MQFLTPPISSDSYNLPSHMARPTRGHTYNDEFHQASRWGCGRIAVSLRTRSEPLNSINWHSVPGTPTPGFLEAFRQGLRELGYVEGQDITFEVRNAEGYDHGSRRSLIIWWNSKLM
jgi:hypothetical protein